MAGENELRDQKSEHWAHTQWTWPELSHNKAVMTIFLSVMTNIIGKM